jgi:hypothetical protein
VARRGCDLQAAAGAVQVSPLYFDMVARPVAGFPAALLVYPQIDGMGP